MHAALATRIERHVDQAAAALLAAACAHAAFAWLGSFYSSPTILIQAGAVAVTFYLAVSRALAAVGDDRSPVSVPVFDLRSIDMDELPELLLTDRYPPAKAPLILDDVLAALEPDSRVVRLFHPAAMPTAGQLNERIERHLGSTARSEPPDSPDASQALHDALSELRKSLR